MRYMEIFYTIFLQIKKIPNRTNTVSRTCTFYTRKNLCPLEGALTKNPPHPPPRGHNTHVTKLIENTVTNHDTKERKLLQQRVKGEHVHTYETLRVLFNFKGSFVHDMEDLKITSHVSKVAQNGEAGHSIPFIESNGSLTRGMERKKTQKYLQKYTLLLFI